MNLPTGRSLYADVPGVAALMDFYSQTLRGSIPVPFYLLTTDRWRLDAASGRTVIGTYARTQGKGTRGNEQDNSSGSNNSL